MVKQKKVTFRFYAELNDFLPEAYRQKDLIYRFWGKPSVKDAIEAIGVPHPEIDLILVNNKSVDFNYRLKDGDRIAVFPTFELLDISSLIQLRPRPLRNIKFILDVNLGKLARNLRMLGFDTQYSNKYKDEEVIQKAIEEHRIILTRDQGLLKNKQVTHGYWVRNIRPDEQTKEILKKFDLFSQIKPLTRCLICNRQLETVTKEKIENSLPPRVKAKFTKFHQCPSCGRIYWQGSHFRRMLKTIESWQATTKP